MTDNDHRGLIEEARREHQDGVNHAISTWGPWCYRCQAEYPCLIDRLAKALEAATTPQQDDAQIDGIKALLEDGHFGAASSVIRTLLGRLAGVEHQRDAALARTGGRSCGAG